MTDTAIHPIPKQGKFRRALAAVGAWLLALDYTSFDYTLDRIECLEQELARLKEELRQSRVASSGDVHLGGTARTESSSKNPARLYLGIAAQRRGPKLVFLRALTTLLAAAQAQLDQNAATSKPGKIPPIPT